MSYSDFITRLKATSKEMQINEVKVVEENIDWQDFDEITNDDIDFVFDDLKESFQLDLPDALKNVMIPGNLHLCWHYQIGGSTNTGGEFNLKRTPSLFVNTADTDFADELTDFEKKLYQGGYRFFDGHPQAGDSEVFAILLQGRKLMPNVYHIDLKTEEVAELEIGYFDYLDHTFKLKGLYGWQYLFEDVDFKLLATDISGLGERLHDYPKLFPGVDIEQYLERYRIRGGD